MFQGENDEFKLNLLAEILDKDITDYEHFRKLLRGRGAAKTRNVGKVHEHEAIKPKGTTKYINLRHFVFSRNFIEFVG